MGDFKLTVLTAYVAVHPNGDEGIIGLSSPFGTLPAIGGDEVRMRDLYPEVKKLCEAQGLPFRVLEFHFKEDVTEEVKGKYS